MDSRCKPKQMFSRFEDQYLTDLVHTFGTSDWKTVAYYLPGRTPRQCRERWVNHLKPSLNRDPWTKEEDELLIKKYVVYGRQWATISKFFLNRTPAMCKNRYKKLEKDTPDMDKLLMQYTTMTVEALLSNNKPKKADNTKRRYYIDLPTSGLEMHEGSGVPHIDDIIAHVPSPQ